MHTGNPDRTGGSTVAGRRPVLTTGLSLLLAVFVLIPASRAQEEKNRSDVREQQPTSGPSEQEPGAGVTGREKYNTGWGVTLDNDLFVEQDADYTGGLLVSFSGRRAKEWFFSMDPILGFLHGVTGIDHLGDGPNTYRRHSFELGGSVFTPEDIEKDRPIEDDHPYAGLLFVRNVRRKTNPDTNVTYRSSFTIGVLGTEIIPESQRSLHEFVGSDKPEGWEHQISEGGEPTFLYTLERQDLLYSKRGEGFSDVDLKSTVGGSLGYLTQLQAGVNWRWGHIITSEQDFNPGFGQYVTINSPDAGKTKNGGDSNELFIWGGVNVRLRGYNAMVEGQFRDSDVTFDRSELREVVGGVNLGATYGFRSGPRISFGLRARTPEIISAQSGTPIWGTLTVSQTY